MNVFVPADVGVPEITPVALFSVNPGGSVPLPAVINQEYGVLPPVAASVWLYAVPATPVASVVVGMLRGALMVMPRAFVLVLLFPSVTL